jgi:hypothetical protein
MNHLEPFLLDDYVARPSGLATDVADRIEDHVLRCDRCRASIADSISAADLDRSWAMVERQLQNELSSRTTSSRDNDLSLVASNKDSAARDTRRPLARMLLAAAAFVGVVGGLAWVYRVRPEPASSSAVSAGWEVRRPADEAMFTSAGDLLGISALLEWHGELLVVGAVQTPGGQRHVAWTSAGGGRWAQREIEFPQGCDPWGGIAVRGEELMIGCVRIDVSRPVVSVATTPDFETWTMHEVGAVSSSFGIVVGSDGGRAVSVAVLEADDPNTTQGARLRVWSSDDLSSWDQLAGSDEVFTDAFAQRIRHFGDDVVIVGAVNTWPNGPAGPAGQVPAVWVSRDGAPFTRLLLPDESGAPAIGYAHDITATDDGFVVVGGANGRARAWLSADLGSWDVAVVTDPEPLGPSGAGAMWSVAAADGSNLLAAAVGDPSVETPTWSSRDGGRTWQPAGDGPSMVLGHDHAIVGVRTDEPVGLWWLQIG